MTLAVREFHCVITSIFLGYPILFSCHCRDTQNHTKTILSSKARPWILNTPFSSLSLLPPSLSATMLVDLQLLPLKPEVWLKHLPQLMSLLAYPCYDSRGIEMCSISRTQWLAALMYDHIGLVLTLEIVWNNNTEGKRYVLNMQVQMGSKKVQ